MISCNEFNVICSLFITILIYYTTLTLKLIVSLDVVM